MRGEKVHEVSSKQRKREKRKKGEDAMDGPPTEVKSTQCVQEKSDGEQNNTA